MTVIAEHTPLDLPELQVFDDDGFPRVRLYAGRSSRSALAAYEQIVSTPGLWSLFDNFYTLAPTYKRLGELYEARGDRARARDYYGRFVDLWKDADPELQPMVRDVRGRLARLAGEQ